LRIALIILCILSSYTTVLPEQPRETEVDVKRTITAEVTAYNENDDYTPGTTMANGKEVHYGAVANDALPLGTIVRINGEIFEVSDRFGNGNPIERFDIYMPSRSACERFGRQWITVEIKEEQ
jgi:3D (Asp-Asp-Asp) domain-containing protein